MSAPTPNPDNLTLSSSQAQDPEGTRAPESPMETREAADAIETMRDRMLTPDETTALIRGLPPEPEQDLSNADDPAQAQMVQDHFPQVAGPEGQPVVPPEQLPGGAAPAIPGVPPVQQPGVQQVPPQPGQTQMPQQVPVQQPQTPEQQALAGQITLLTQQNELLQQQLQQAQATPAPQQAQPGQQQQQQQDQPFAFDVPDSYMSALADENASTRRTALNGILNGVANTVAQQVRQEFSQQLQAVPQMVQQHTQQVVTEADISRDMYGTYPELTPYKQLVSATAQSLVSQGHGSDWNANLRDLIAERLAPMLPGSNIGSRIQSNRAARGVVAPQPQVYAQQPQALPQPQQPQQPQQSMPPGVAPVAVGGVQMVPQAPPQQQPVLARDPVTGQLVQIPAVPQQPLVGGAQARQNGGGQVDPTTWDVWTTLGY